MDSNTTPNVIFPAYANVDGGQLRLMGEEMAPGPPIRWLLIETAVAKPSQMDRKMGQKNQKPNRIKD